MGTFQLLDLFSNKALTGTSVKAPSGPLCFTLMTCHSCCTRKPSKVKLWPTAKEALCTVETLVAESLSIQLTSVFQNAAIREEQDRKWAQVRGKKGSEMKRESRDRSRNARLQDSVTHRHN